MRICEVCSSPNPAGGSSVRFCRSCYEKQRRINNPENYQKWLKKRSKDKRDKARAKRGLPSDHPRLISEYGKGHIDKRGYKCIVKRGHPNAKNSKGRIYEHVWIMSESLGRALNEGETVHHKNGMRSDNRIENLELWSKSQPSGQRVEDKIEWCKNFLREYGYNIPDAVE